MLEYPPTRHTPASPSSYAYWSVYLHNMLASPWELVCAGVCLPERALRRLTRAQDGCKRHGGRAVKLLLDKERCLARVTVQALQMLSRGTLPVS